MNTISKEFLQKRIAELRAIKEAKALKNPEPQIAETVLPISETLAESNSYILDRYGKTIQLNEKQQAFVKLAGVEGKSAVLLGAAGTGKTTTQRAVCQALIDSGRAGFLSSSGHKHLRSGTPGIVICAYTKRAVANIQRNLPEDLQANAITVHKLLEFEPVYYETIDEKTGNIVNKRIFEPGRTPENPLPESIHTIIYEETSMLGTDLYGLVKAASPHEPQEIFLGDIQQLPPVFGPAILGFKMLELPTLELTEVYRQALDSPIISLAHRFLSGNGIKETEFQELKVPGKLSIKAWPKPVSSDDAISAAAAMFTGAHGKSGLIQAGKYDPLEDIILLPFNKAFGTIELNKFIANHIARSSGVKTYEVIAGFNKLYLSPGDKVMYSKEDAIVESIEPNPDYTGAPAHPASETLDYWGVDTSAKKSSDFDPGTVDIDHILLMTSGKDTGERVRKASHTISVRMQGSQELIKLSTASELNNLDLGYALTVHKAQGSEWRRVFFILHHTHAIMISRELLYTAVTRAREELVIVCEKDTLLKGVASQRVKGNTLQEKAEFFKGKAEALK